MLLDRDLSVEFKKQWRFLITLSNGACGAIVVVWILDWYNLDQIELVINDPAAKAYWLQTQHFYDRLGWISLVVMIGLRVTYWTAEYIHDRRLMAKETDGRASR